MSIYVCYAIPVITSLVLFFFFKHKIVWWEVIAIIVIPSLFILIAKWISISSLTSDTEWFGGYVTEVRYYQAWDEEVPCRHPKMCTRYKSCCYKDSKGRCSGGCTEEYQCGWQHAYDVDYHPEHWDCLTTLDDYSISQSRYEQLVRQFGTGKQFVDQHRRYHSIDGDMYSTKWNGDNETLEPVVKEHTYENRPMASKSVFHFQDVDTFDIKQYKPFNYPEITNQFHQKVIMGYNDPIAEKKLQVLNSRLGHPKQVRVFIVVFKGQPLEAGHIQERYWGGSNKNEFIVTIGVNDANEIKWVYDFSWTEVEEAKIETREFILAQKTLDLSTTVDYLYKEIETKWVRRPFHSFDYLSIEPTITQTIVIFILTILVCGGIGWWAVANEFDEDYKYN